MQNQQPQPVEKPARLFGRMKLGSSSTWSFGKKGPLPAKTNQTSGRSRSKKRSWLLTLFLGVAVLAAWYLIHTLKERAAATAMEQAAFMPLDEDYQAANKEGLCRLPSVPEIQGAGEDSPTPQVVGVVAVKENNTLSDKLPKVKGKRPVIELDQLVYFEKMTRNRVRVLFENGSCSLYKYQDLLYNIQTQESCNYFQPVPRDGVATEYINVHYIEGFERVKCSSGDLYRAKLAIAGDEQVDCATSRVIQKAGVGLFSVYVYRKLRHLMEEINPHVDYSYRRVVRLEGC